MTREAREREKKTRKEIAILWEKYFDRRVFARAFIKLHRNSDIFKTNTAFYNYHRNWFQCDVAQFNQMHAI